MQFEVIKKSHKKEVVIGVVAIILIAIVLLVRNSFAKYQITKSLKIAEGTINYTVPDFKVMAMYKNDGSGDTSIDTMPESGYTINTKKSYCTTDNINKVYNKMYTDENSQHIITGLEKNSKCYLYFDKQTTKNVNTPLGIIKVNLESPDSFTIPATGNEGVFEAQDDDGDTYYWRGAVTNNYVKFGKDKDNKDMYWRIIRVNGDGTIRLIYQGPSATSNGQIDSASAFNSNNNDNKYVGFQYKSGDVHGYGTESTNSTILGTLNTWYETNIEKKGYSGKVDPNAGFCNDRYPSTTMGTSNGSGGTETTTTYYGALMRIMNSSGGWETTQKPTFKCKDSRDLFTKSGATKKDGTTNGNGALTNPVGLITADEVVYAGGFGGKANSSYYLYTGQNYWTLSPCMYGNARVFSVLSTGYLNVSNVTDTIGVRPVINLRANTKFTYNSETTKGTMKDSYVVE